MTIGLDVASSDMVVRFYRAATRYGHRKFSAWPEEAEDFASWATIKMIRGYRKPLQRIFADYCKERFVNFDIKSKDQKEAFVYAACYESLTVVVTPEPNRVLEEIPWKRIKARTRNAMRLYLEGYEQSEIGEMYGVSKQAVHMWFKTAGRAA